MLHSTRHRLPRSLGVALVVFLLAAVAAASLIWRLNQVHLQDARTSAVSLADIHADVLERSIERALSATYALAVLVRQGNGAIRDFDAIASGMLPLYPGAASLQLAPRGVVQSIVPLAGNEKSVGLDLLNDPRRSKEASLARDSGKLVLAGPFNLVRGGVGAVGWLPVFLDDAKGYRYFWGFTSVLIRFPEVLDAADFPGLTKQGFDYELWRNDADTGQKLIIAASSSAALIEPVGYDLNMPNATWTLSVAPTKGWSDPLRLSLEAIVSLLFSLLLAYMAKLMVESRAHEKGLEALVAHRTAEVQASEMRYRAVAQSANDAIITADSAGNIVGWNRGAEILFGYTEAEVNAQPLTLLMPPRYHDRHLAGMNRIWPGGEAHIPRKAVELTGLHKDKNEFPLELSLARWEIAEGCFVTYIIRDITERKQGEEALRAAEEQFRSLVEQSIAGSYIIQDNQLAYVNQRFAEIFGYTSADELIGRDPGLIVAEKDRGIVAQNIRLRIQGDLQTLSSGFTGQRKDGSLIEIGFNSARATYRGRPAIIGLMQDISDKKRAEEEIGRYVAQLETAFRSTVEVATTLSEMRDPYTAGHERRVGEIAAAIGAELGFDARRQEGLRVAGHLHDIGKITIPSEILSKPGKLSPIEFLLIKGHSQASYDVLKEVEFPWPVAQVALQHHERTDGSGYPQGLKGEAILLEARIMAVADVVEAMFSHRPYRPGLGIGAALSEIERGRGTVYDAVVADACLKVFREKNYALSA